MKLLATIAVGVPLALFAYAYVAYPLILYAASRGRRRAKPPEPAEWPSVTIVVVAHNAARAIRRTLEHLTAVDYPTDRLQILVVSDGSTDGTDAIVRELAADGVELHRVEPRGGKTAAENAVGHLVRGDVVVSTDATLVVLPASVKALARHFSDPTVGVVSGRGVSITPAAHRDAARTTVGEARYLTYETRVRALESAFGSIMGATGQLYAQRRELFQTRLAPTYVTRDFASALLAHELGYRSVQENEATCLVVRNASLRREYERKARTIVLGLDTLRHYAHLLNPIGHGWFAFMLLSHKPCRWLAFLLAPVMLAGLAALSATSALALVTLLVLLAGLTAGGLAVYWPFARPVPAVLGACGYAVASVAAGLAGWSRFLRGRHATMWNPTERAEAGSGKWEAGCGMREVGSGKRETGNGMREVGSGKREPATGQGNVAGAKACG